MPRVFSDRPRSREGPPQLSLRPVVSHPGPPETPLATHFLLAGGHRLPPMVGDQGDCLPPIFGGRSQVNQDSTLRNLGSSQVTRA